MRGSEETERAECMVDLRAETLVLSDKTEFTETRDPSTTQQHNRAVMCEG